MSFFSRKEVKVLSENIPGFFPNFLGKIPELQGWYRHFFFFKFQYQISSEVPVLFTMSAVISYTTFMYSIILDQ